MFSHSQPQSGRCFFCLAAGWDLSSTGMGVRREGSFAVQGLAGCLGVCAGVGLVKVVEEVLCPSLLCPGLCGHMA